MVVFERSSVLLAKGVKETSEIRLMRHLEDCVLSKATKEAIHRSPRVDVNGVHLFPSSDQALIMVDSSEEGTQKYEHFKFIL